MHVALPCLKQDFELHDAPNRRTRTFVSKRGWDNAEKKSAMAAHDAYGLKLTNFGASDGWMYDRGVKIFPALTAGMLMAFAMSSWSRYRPNLLERLEKSRVNLLCDVFCSEIDALMIPAFRNLIFGENLRVAGLDYI